MNDLPNFTENREFEFLIQPRTESYTDELAEDIVDHGCIVPIEVWENYIIDGHLRYDICRKWEVPFKLKCFLSAMKMKPSPICAANSLSVPTSRENTSVTFLAGSSVPTWRLPLTDIWKNTPNMN